MESRTICCQDEGPADSQWMVNGQRVAREKGVESREVQGTGIRASCSLTAEVHYPFLSLPGDVFCLNVTGLLPLDRDVG